MTWSSVASFITAACLAGGERAGGNGFLASALRGRGSRVTRGSRLDALGPGRSAVDASGEGLLAEALLENTSVVVGGLVPVAAHDVVDVRAVLLCVGTKAGTEAELLFTRKEESETAT